MTRLVRDRVQSTTKWLDESRMQVDACSDRQFTELKRRASDLHSKLLSVKTPQGVTSVPLLQSLCVLEAELRITVVFHPMFRAVLNRFLSAAKAFDTLENL